MPSPRRRLLTLAAAASVLLASPGAIPLSPPATARAANAPLTAAQIADHLSAQVYGFLPYWELDGATDGYLRYDLLSDIALFSVGLTCSCAIGTCTPGYAAATGSLADEIVARAHAAGVRVDLTVTSFGLSRNNAFFDNTTAQTAAVSAIAALVRQRGFDGVNVDVESLHNVDFPAYAAWVGRIRTAIRKDNGAARVTVATNGAISGAQMAAAAIKAGADRAFLMGYSYRSSGSSPAGSISPVVRADGGKSLTWSLDTYADYDVPSSRILLGLPYYGLTWPTSSGTAHASTVGAGSAFIPETDMGDIPSGTTIHYDTLEESPWFAVEDKAGGWTETYFDNPRSLGAKYALITSRRLAGTGIWALGYDRGVAGYWDALATAFDPPATTYHPVTPGRVLDSRTGLGSGTFQMGVPRSFQVTGHAGVPSNATAVTGTLTVASATGAGYVSLTPTSQAKPTSSTLNFPTHDVRATGVTVKLGSGGKLWATYRALHTSDTAKLVFDVTGYFTP
jgi:hypothetical protein